MVMVKIESQQARALARANGMTHEDISWAFRPTNQGEIIVIFPEGTKVYRKGRSFFLYGYTDTDVPRTLARLAGLPKYRAPRKSK